ncbi:MAG: cytochrome c oxidase subunit I [Euzebyaceae bacterium]|nr:cytochrome c oxidase subunit I [Euzebyaceae bacterium]
MTTVTGDRLEDVWATRPGLVGWLGAVNHKQVGQRFIATAFVFFLVGGVQSLFMRYQLGSPESTFLDPETYNQLFTMHGTTMMFLFAVPIGEAFGIYFVPLMLGARDMPFPRLNAFGYWAYLFGGIFLYSSFLAGSVPDSGWYAYPPLSGPEYSPRSNLDFWLLGVTFVEVSGVIAAFEIVVLILRFRAPGMAISRMPLFVWSLLVTATMILVAFPPLIMGTVLLELDRKVGTGFYDPAVGGDPMLWQHIFWWFGHPEVYIILLPAIGIVSAILPVFTRTRIVGYTFIAAATVAIGILSFGVWVHHMFTTGINLLGLTFFTAGSLLITIPGGVQIFAFIATLWRGRPVFKPPLLHVIGFLVVFVFGGLSGVMVASVPFDWQAHDTYFVVAHFHYVLIGGVLFPVLAGLTYWLPKMTGRLLDDRLGTVAFWLLFAGFNLTFLPQHVVGLLGMPRRVYTYPSGIGWDVYNLLSTVGAFVVAAGMAVFVADVVRSRWRGAPAGDDPWGGNTLEWATTSPPEPFNFRVIPIATTRDPLWDERPLDLAGGPAWRRELAHPVVSRREMVSTSVLDAAPHEVLTLPIHSLWPLGLAAALGVFLIGVMVDRTSIGLVGLAGLAVCVIGWLWSRQDEP